jgi:outer membrane protein OmpA-like peptidoglycan-associated protein
MKWLVINSVRQVIRKVFIMNTLKLTVCGVAIMFGLLSGPVIADSDNLYVKKYDSFLSQTQKLELRNYSQYEQREPCQNYQILPMNFYQERCVLFYRYPETPKSSVTLAEAYINRVVLASYTIEFAFDSSLIERSSMPVLDKIANDISTYLPRDVTVSGYTDSKGTDEYNVSLSQRRADSVSQFLKDRGVANRILGSQAFGETNQAVRTEDGVPLRANRRVIVEFLK